MMLKKDANSHFLQVKEGNYDLYINMNDLVKKDGLYQIAEIEFDEEENSYMVVTGIIDENLNELLPVRLEKVKKEVFEVNKNSREISLYNNKMAIYKAQENECYVIALDKVSFQLSDGMDIPLNPIFRMEYYVKIDNDIIIAFYKDKAWVYDVSNRRQIGNIYDFIIPENECFAVYYITEEYGFSMNVKLSMKKDGTVGTEAHINNAISVTIPKSKLNSRSEVLSYCFSCIESVITPLNQGTALQ